MATVTYRHPDVDPEVLAIIGENYMIDAHRLVVLCREEHYFHQNASLTYLYAYDATAFNNLNEAKKYIEKYIEEFGDIEYSFAFMEPVTVMKNYYSHEILEEV